MSRRHVKTYVRDANIPAPVIRNVHNEPRRALRLQPLQPRQQVPLQVLKRVPREAPQREHPSRLIVEQVELDDARAPRLRVRWGERWGQRDVELRRRVEHDVHRVPFLRRGVGHRGLAERV